MSTDLLAVTMLVITKDGEVINSPVAKGIRRLLVKDFFENTDAKVRYLRTPKYVQVHGRYNKISKGDPYGVVISRIMNGRLYIGWSLLHRKDAGKFNRDVGVIAAVSRMEPAENYMNTEKVPHDVRKMVAYIMSKKVLNLGSK